MRKRNYNFIFILVILLCNIVSFANQDNLELERVLIFSRHGLRSPLTTPGSRLSKATPYKWEEWDVKASFLTKKGANLEVYFGQYINEWLEKNKIIDSGKCLNPNEVNIYTNSLQRTIATGQALTLGIFPGCNIESVHKMEIGKMDPVFNPVIRTDDETFKKQALNAMHLEKENKKLKDSYLLLSERIDYKNSEICLVEKNCNFYNEEGKLKIEKDKEPGVDGPIRFGTQIVDALLLQYYEGYPKEKIVNNNIKSDEEWVKLNKIKDGYGELLFGSKVVAKHVAKPLINYIYNDLVNTEHKVTVLVGHDSNVVSLLSALDFEEYALDNHFESTPIGGKIFFEVWKDKVTNERKIKIEYVYQKVNQIRNKETLSLKNPPSHTTLKMKNCKVDKQGYCSYETFKKILKNFN